jgi:uncharacterized protein (DUF305 family)
MPHSDKHGKTHYCHFAIMVVLSFISMYILMYAMVDRFANIYPNFNQFYMAGLMTAPMIVIELALMGEMHKNKRLNVTIIIISILAGITFFAGIRQQAAIGDEQFLKSMIPHHAGAILMCNEAPVQDTEIQSLCRNITSNQQSEIDQMKTILARLDKQP